MKVRLLKILGICFFLSMLMGCSTFGSDWSPVYTYDYSCSTDIMPELPLCLVVDGYGEGFDSSGEFYACKQSLLNYIDVLNSYYECSERKLRDVFDTLIEEVNTTYYCYETFFKENDGGEGLSQSCPTVKVPHFVPSYEADGLELMPGVPQCIRENENFNFKPRNRDELNGCREQVDVFTGEASILSYTRNAASAQDQYNRYLISLRSVIDHKIRAATNQFNCIAEGRDFCVQF